MAYGDDALTKLFADVKALATAEAFTGSIVFGDREVRKTTNQGTGRANRVVFAPGDEKGVAGKYVNPKKPGSKGTTPRHLRDFIAFCRVYCWGFDATAPRDELKQWKAAMAIHEWAVRAIHLKAFGTYQISAPRWLRDPMDAARLGDELMFMLEIEIPLLDTPYSVAPGGTVFVTPSVLELPLGDTQGCPGN